MFYKVSEKQMLKDRNNLFKEVGILALQKNNFVRSPFSTSWNGEYYDGIQGYLYEFGRISKDDLFESIKVFIVKGDKYIDVFINIFRISPELKIINELKYFEGTKFDIPPNSITKMRLRNDDYKGPPLFYMLFLPENKIGRFYTKSGYEAELSKLKKFIKSDRLKDFNC